MAKSGSAARSKARRSGAKKAAPVALAKSEAKTPASGAPPKKQAALHETTGIKGWYDRVVKFLTSVRDEMERVNWPSGKELRVATIVVMVTLVMVSAYMGVVNYVFSVIFGTPESTGL